MYILRFIAIDKTSGFVGFSPDNFFYIYWPVPIFLNIIDVNKPLTASAKCVI